MVEFSNHIKKNSLAERLIRSVASFFFFVSRKTTLVRKARGERVLVVSLHKLGDTVYTIPSIKALKRKFGQKLTLVCYPDSKKIYDLIFDNVDYVVLNKEDFRFEGRIAKSESRGRIKLIEAGMIVDLTCSITSASLIYNSRAEKIFGFADGYLNKLYSDFVQKRKTPHLMDLYLDVAKLLINVDGENELKNFPLLKKIDGYILIHPFAGWKSKEWNLNNFLELYIRLSKTFSSKLIFPRDRLTYQIESELKKNNTCFVISNDVRDLIETIKGASMVVGCDSGAVNIASVLGKPTFTIYGPTNPKFSLPFGEHHDFIINKTVLSPNENEQYGFADAGRKVTGLDFMNLITADKVYERIIKLYQKVYQTTL